MSGFCREKKQQHISWHILIRGDHLLNYTQIVDKSSIHNSDWLIFLPCLCFILNYEYIIYVEKSFQVLSIGSWQVNLMWHSTYLPLVSSCHRFSSTAQHPDFAHQYSPDRVFSLAGSAHGFLLLKGSVVPDCLGPCTSPAAPKLLRHHFNCSKLEQ